MAKPSLILTVYSKNQGVVHQAVFWKDTYIRRDNLVIISHDDEPDTLRVTDGALRLTGTFDGTPSVLKRNPQIN